MDTKVLAKGLKRKDPLLGVDLEREKDLIQRKKSNLSRSLREEVLERLSLSESQQATGLEPQELVKDFEGQKEKEEEENEERRG